MAEISQKMQDALRTEYAEQATQSQFDLWIEKCQRDNLVPVEDVVLQIRTVSEYDPETRSKVRRKRPIYITTVRALLKIASRTGKYQGKLPTEWIYLDAQGMPTISSTVPLPDKDDPTQPRKPWAAKVAVRHADFPDPVVEPVRFDAYAQTVTRDNQTFLNNTWATRGPEQLAKCGLAASLRVCFPEFGGLYLSEELERDEETHSEPVPAVAAAPLPVLSSLPAPVAVQANPTPEPPANNVNLTQIEVDTARAALKEAVVPLLKEIAKDPEIELKLREKGLRISQSAVSALVDDLSSAVQNPDADPVPTKEENKANLDKLRTYKVDRESMRLYLERDHGVADTKVLNKTFTACRWKKLFSELDAAVAANTLDAVIKGEPKE